MSTVSQNTRRLLAALGALAIAASNGIAVEFAFRAVAERFHPDGTAVAGHFSWMASQWFFMLPAVVDGLVATKLAQFRQPAYLLAMTSIQGLLVVRSQPFADSATFVPTALWLLTFITTPLPITFLGWL